MQEKDDFIKDSTFYYGLGSPFRVVGYVAENSRHISQLFYLYEVPKKIERIDIEIPKSSEITVGNISFKFPDSDREEIKSVSLMIRAGEKIAFRE